MIKKNVWYVMKWLLGFFLCLKYIRNSNDTYFLVHGHIGEAVYSLSLLDEIKKNRHINTINVIARKPYEQIANLYKSEINNIVTLSIKQVSWMVLYTESHVNFHNNIIGSAWYWEKTPELMLSAPEVYYTGYWYKVCHLQIPYNAEHKRYNTNELMDDDFMTIIDKYCIKKGQSIILAPYAQTSDCLEIEIWERITYILLEKGYYVYTNIKDENEEVIKGTLPIIVPLKYINSVIKYAGAAICIRSGLTDLLAMGDCNADIIYYVSDALQQRLTNIWRVKLGENTILNRNAYVIYANDCESLNNFYKELQGKY